MASGPILEPPPLTFTIVQYCCLVFLVVALHSYLQLLTLLLLKTEMKCACDCSTLFSK